MEPKQDMEPWIPGRQLGQPRYQPRHHFTHTTTTELRKEHYGIEIFLN